jgi:predicted nucleic acid-binding protein
VQAAAVGAIVIVDDPWGRGLANRFDRECHGTIWILRRFFELGLASDTMTRGYFVALFDRGIRLPRSIVNDLLVESASRRWCRSIALSASRLRVANRGG